MGTKFRASKTFADAKNLAESKSNVTKKAEELNLGNTDKLFARTQISFISVLKFYYQWLLLIIMHFIAMFYLPIDGNRNMHKNHQLYCDPVDK